MAPSRLKDSHKQEILVRYRAGETSALIASAFGCSANTVSRTVRSLLSAEEYAELKVQRASKNTVPEIGLTVINSHEVNASKPSDSNDLNQIQKDLPSQTVEVSSGDFTDSESIDKGDDGKTLALDDADDFGAEDRDESDGFDFEEEEVFQEIAVLPVDLPQVTTQEVPCRQFASELLPESVYMLVDKTVELEPRPLSDFPELGLRDPSEQQRQALCLYTTPRAAKRQCGRSQRVIKVPDTQVFEQTSSYLLARGITHLVVEGSLFALTT